MNLGHPGSHGSHGPICPTPGPNHRDSGGSSGHSWALGKPLGVVTSDQVKHHVRSVVFQTIPGKKCWFLKSTFFYRGTTMRLQMPNHSGISSCPNLVETSTSIPQQSGRIAWESIKKQIDCHWRFSMLPWFSDRLNRDVVVQSFWIWGARDPKKQLLVVALAASLLALCLSPGIHWVTINWSKKNETQQFNKRYYIYIFILIYTSKQKSSKNYTTFTSGSSQQPLSTKRPRMIKLKVMMLVTA